MKITDSIFYAGVNDHELDLFEGQYKVPDGISYNSFVIMDEKIAVMDTVDHRKQTEFLKKLKELLGERKPDYLIVSHVEPDHASGIKALVEQYPDIILVGNSKTFQMLPYYTELDYRKAITVKEGDRLNLGSHELTFLMAPMVHWPEVMMTYECREKVLFSADVFGRFGALDADVEWDDEARRYYYNIVGKYGKQAQMILKKAEAFEIQIICPLHGPVLAEKNAIAHAFRQYQIWTSYGVESEGILIAYASLHGNTAEAAILLAEILKQKGCPEVIVMDLVRKDSAEALENAFRYGKIVLAASTYNGGVMPFMEDFLHHLLAKNYQKRIVALIENSSWAPAAAKTMWKILEQMKEIHRIEPVITLRGCVKADDIATLGQLADVLMKE